jgi:hypothetical protein
MATIDGDHSKSGVVREANASISLSLKALIACVATATFSPDIAVQYLDPDCLKPGQGSHLSPDKQEGLALPLIEVPIG